VFHPAGLADCFYISSTKKEKVRDREPFSPISSLAFRAVMIGAEMGRLFHLDPARDVLLAASGFEQLFPRRRWIVVAHTMMRLTVVRISVGMVVAGSEIEREAAGTFERCRESRLVARRGALLFLLAVIVLCPSLRAISSRAIKTQLACSPQKTTMIAAAADRAPSSGDFSRGDHRTGAISPVSPQLMVIGFMGGKVQPDNLVHREAMLAKNLEERYPLGVHASVFANHDSTGALDAVLHQLDRDHDGCLTTLEKSSARIVIFGHSWGASETVTLARRLNEMGIPVLLTIQVDSVQKADEDDKRIPPNVREAINFYQKDGLLHGRRKIAAMEPERTTILGNFESSYRDKPVSCAGFPWYARAFMKPHIEIENDPSVWNRIEGLIAAKVF
jgi:hypothetical protein